MSYLRRLFPVERLSIHSFCIGVNKKEELCSQKQSVIVINKKFKYLIEEWNLPKYNTIVPVTVELNAQELLDIQKAVTHYEYENFFDFITQISR